MPTKSGAAGAAPNRSDPQTEIARYDDSPCGAYREAGGETVKLWELLKLDMWQHEVETSRSFR